MDEWISVKDRLPESGEEVLAFDDGDRIVARMLYCNDWYETWTDAPLFDVTHWVPLPDPPKETP